MVNLHPVRQLLFCQILRKNIYFRNNIVICQNNKYGFCKLSKKCEERQFTDICERKNEEKHTTAIKHPYKRYYRHSYGRSCFERLRMCRFGIFYAYIHIKSEETKLCRRRWESHGFSCHSNDPPEESSKPQPCPAVFILLEFSRSRSEQTPGNGFHPRDESVT